MAGEDEGDGHGTEDSETQAEELEDSVQAGTETGADSSATERSVFSWRSLGPWGGLLTGIATALGLIFGAGSLLLDFRSQNVELDAAEVNAEATRLSLSPVAEFVYCLGPPGTAVGRSGHDVQPSSGVPRLPGCADPRGLVHRRTERPPDRRRCVLRDQRV